MNLNRKTLSSFLAIAFALLFAPTLGPALAQEEIGEVEAVNVGAYGTVASRGRVQLSLRDSIFQNEFIETLPGGGLTLRFEDDTSFHLGGDSEATLDNFLYDPDAQRSDGLVNLGKGVFRFISNSKDDEGLAFTTSTAVIGVRGTDFVVVMGEDGRTRVGTVSGLVDITPEGSAEPVEVRPGYYASLGEASGDLVVRSAPVRARDLACWLTSDDHICNAVPQSVAAPEGGFGGLPGGDGGSAGVGGVGNGRGGGVGPEGASRGGNRSGGADGTNPGGQGNEGGSENPS